MRGFFSGFIIVFLFLSNLSSTPLKVSAYTKGKRQVFLFADYHDQFVRNDADFDKARCEWSNACIDLLTQKDAQYRILVEDKDVLASRIKPLFNKNISIEQVRRAVNADRLGKFISVFSALGLDSRLTATGVDLINVTSSISLTLSKMVYELRELEEHYKIERGLAAEAMDVFLNFIERAVSQLEITEKKKSVYLTYTFDQLLSELSILKDYYKKVLVICESFEKRPHQILKSYRATLDGLDKYIKQINDFLKENKLKENLYQPIYTILQNKFIESKTSQNPEALKFVEVLSDLIFYPKEYIPELVSTPYFILNDRDLQAINKIFESSDEVPVIAVMGGFHTRNIGDFLKKDGFKEEVLAEGYVLSKDGEKYNPDAAIEFVGNPAKVVACSATVLERVKNYKNS